MVESTKDLPLPLRILISQTALLKRENMLNFIKAILDFIAKILGLSSKTGLDQAIEDKQDEVKRIENEDRDVNDIIDDLNKK